MRKESIKESRIRKDWEEIAKVNLLRKALMEKR